MPRADAAKLLEDITRWAAEVNSRSSLTIRIERLDVYGSYLSTSADVGDLDIIVVFNEEQLLESDEFQPEHQYEMEVLLEELRGISEYVSPADVFDQLAMPKATYKTVFRR